MEEAHKTQIFAQLADLIQKTTNVEGVTQFLVGKNLLTTVEKEYIMRKEDDEGRSYELYKFITKKGATAYGLLTDALRETGNNAAIDILNSPANVQDSVDIFDSIE